MAKLKIDQYLDWQHHNTRANCSMYFLAKWMKPLVTKKPVDQGQVEKTQKQMETTLGQIETFWLDNGNKPYIGGQNISVADIWACCELEQPSIAG